MNNAMMASLLCLNRRTISWVWEISPTLLSATAAAAAGSVVPSSNPAPVI